MASNTDEEHPVNVTNTQSETIEEEVIPSNRSQTISPNPAAESIGAHPQPDLHDKSKKWKDYFLEFLMIFLAVTMGFIAENIREHFSETKTAQQNLEAYRNDLLQHEKQFKENIADFNKVLPIYDSIVSIFYERRENEELPVLSRLLLQGQINYVVTINTPTYQQLISSGSFRFIENSELKASMANYQDQINAYINYNDRIVNTLNDQLGEIGKIEDLHDFWNREKMGDFQKYNPDMQPFSLSREQRNFIIAYNKVFSVQFQAGLSQINKLLKSNSALLKALDKELNKN